MSQKDDCLLESEELSAFLDEALPTEDAQRVLAHLRQCAACRKRSEVYRQIETWTRSLEASPLRSATRQRIRAAARAEIGLVAASRAWWRRPSAAAAVLLIAGASFSLGRLSGPVGSEPTYGPSRVLEATSSLDLGAAGAVRAARALLTDVGIIDDVPESLRGPVLGAQIEQFDLLAWAREVETHPNRHGTEERQVADFLQRLASAVASGRQTELLKLRKEALGRNLWSATLAAPAPQPAGLQLRWDQRRPDVIARVARELRPEHQAALSGLLEIKEAWVLGAVGRAVNLTAEQRPESFDPLVGLSVASALGEVGFHDLAVPYLVHLRDRAPDATRAVVSSFPQDISLRIAEIRPAATAALLLPSSGWVHALETLFVERGSGEIEVEERCINGQWVLNAVVRSQPR